MIELFDDYVIIVGDFDYALARKTGRVDKRSGKPTFDNIGYFGTVGAALERLVDIYTKNALKGRSMDLCEAVRAIRESHDRVAKLIESVEELK